jgi:hypothetical protein
MAWDKSGTAKEVESLKKRYPKRGIDPTIPAEIRQTLRDREQEKEMTMGEKNRYARGGNVKSSSVAPAKMMTVQPTVPTPEPSPIPIKAPAQYQPGYQSPAPSTSLPTPIKAPAQYQPGTQKKLPPSEAGRGTGIRKQYAGGGSVRGGGCEQRGKTRGKFV